VTGVQVGLEKKEVVEGEDLAECEEHDIENVCFIAYVAAKVIHRTTNRSKSIKILREQNVKCFVGIKENGISLTQKAEYMDNKIKSNYQVGKG
jgi:hypothetical protein